MQNKIDKIIQTNLWFEDKIKALKDLFLKENITYFSDFDDTLSDNSCVFYTKVKLLRKFRKFNKKHINKLLNTFKINSNFPLKNSEKFIIISRNKHSFLKEFLKKHQKTLHKNNINLVWVIWNDDNFKYSSFDKLKFLNENNTFIWDSFENKDLQNYKNFINVAHFSKTKIKLVQLKKIFILIKFILKWF